MLAPPAWPNELSLLRLLVLIITWYMLWFMGRELEAAWGSFRYTAFVMFDFRIPVDIDPGFDTWIHGGD